MAEGDLFELDEETLATVENGIDSLIHQLGKNCDLIFEIEPGTCPNCIFNSQTNRSSNIYNGVGPNPFTAGKCPVCKGNGYLSGTSIQKETVQFLIDWQPKAYTYFGPNAGILLPNGVVSTKGFIADYPKVIQAKYCIIDTANTTYASNRFVKWGEPIVTGNIVKGKYFVTFWQRHGQ